MGIVWVNMFGAIFFESAHMLKAGFLMTRLNCLVILQLWVRACLKGNVKQVKFSLSMVRCNFLGISRFYLYLMIDSAERNDLEVP